MLCDEWSSEQSLADSVHNSVELAFVHDSVRLIYVSQSLANLLGYSVQEMEGRLIISFLTSTAFLKMIHAISKNRVNSLTGRTSEFEPQPTKLRDKAGNLICLQATCSVDLPAEKLDIKRNVRLTVVEQVPI